MEANPKNIFTTKVEDGKPGKDGWPAVGPVFQSSLAKDGFSPLEPDMQTHFIFVLSCHISMIKAKLERQLPKSQSSSDLHFYGGGVA
jgi:hypothetical protein